MTTKAADLTPFFELAIKNITSFGDTDIFPLPFENHVLFDQQDPLIGLLLEAFDEFDHLFALSPPQHIGSLTPVGHTGFRWAAQLDPFWNAFLLGLVLAISERIETSRLPVSSNSIFSYRVDLQPGSNRLFNDEVGFREFLRRSRELAQEYEYVVIGDISDCYSRIPHHQIENAFQQIGIAPDISFRILKILQHFSNEKSFGVPIGGPAARLLVELVLGLTDDLIKQNGYKFCRFVDDYHIFVRSEAEAYKALLFLSEKLARNEGLALQKSKTRVLSSREFLITPDLFSIEEDPDSSHPLKSLLNISLRFDPYSPNREEEYEALRQELDRIDLVHLLNIEFAKSRIHGALTKRIIAAVRHASDLVKGDAVLTLLENLESLYPIFPSVAITFRSIFWELKDDVQQSICDTLCKLVREDHPLALPEVHAAYIVRVLGLIKTSENVDTLVSISKSQLGPLVRKDIILIMANWEEYSWLFNLKNTFGMLTLWERRAFIVASYKMGDAGKHWRVHHEGNFSKFEQEVKHWAADRKQKNPGGWSIPL